MRNPYKIKVSNRFKIVYTNMFTPKENGIMIRFLPCIDLWCSKGENDYCACIGLSWLSFEMAFWFGDVQYI